MLALLLSTAVAAEEIEIENANFPVMNFNNLQRHGYSVMGSPMYIPKPPQRAIDHYNSLNDADFPVDYSMACSNRCGCRQQCTVMWWVPCSCMCPPPCPETTTTPQPPA